MFQLFTEAILRIDELVVDVLEPEPISLWDLVAHQVRITKGTVRNHLIFDIVMKYIAAVDEFVAAVSGSSTCDLLVNRI